MYGLMPSEQTTESIVFRTFDTKPDDGHFVIVPTSSTSVGTDQCLVGICIGHALLFTLQSFFDPFSFLFSACREIETLIPFVWPRHNF